MRHIRKGNASDEGRRCSTYCKIKLEDLPRVDESVAYKNRHTADCPNCKEISARIENMQSNMNTRHGSCLASLVNEVAAISFYGKGRMKKEYDAAVKAMESHPDYPAYKIKIDAENAASEAKKIADNKALDGFLA